MIYVPRFALLLFVLGFGLYHAVLGFIYLPNYEFPGFALAAIISYLLGLGISLLLGNSLRMPNWAAWLNLVIAVAVPILMSQAIQPTAAFGYSTWHVAGIATLMGITAVRGFPIISWLGVGFVVVEINLWGGLEALLNAGIIGALLLIVAAQGASFAMRSSAKSAEQFRQIALDTRVQSETASAVLSERMSRIDGLVESAVPFLRQIANSKSALSSEKKAKLALTERALRDQIRGRGLVVPVLISAVAAARTRGIVVELLDDGGLEGLSEARVLELLSRIAAELEKVESGKVVIRSAPGESWRVSITALRKGADAPDVFLRI